MSAGSERLDRRWSAVRARVIPSLRRRVAARLGRGPSALIIPLPAANHAVPGAYLTLISPFLPASRLDDLAVGELRRILAGVNPFEFRLARVGRFPGVLYLAPEPAEPFVATVEALTRRWPEYPPYEGRFDEVVPHVTAWFAGLVPTLLRGGDREPPGLGERLAAHLPIRAFADQVDLMAMGRGGRWSRRASLRLGGG